MQKSPGGWTGRRFHLGSNKEVFDAEVYAIYQALGTLDQRQEGGHRYTVFMDSTAATDRERGDTIGPGQRFAIVAMEGCSRIGGKDNEVATRTPRDCRQ